MKVLIFYRPDSEYASRVENYVHDFTQGHDIDPRNISLIDVNSRSGSTDASLYDIMAFPGVVVTDDYGAYIKGWSGELPLMDELVSYLFAV